MKELRSQAYFHLDKKDLSARFWELEKHYHSYYKQPIDRLKFYSNDELKPAFTKKQCFYQPLTRFPVVYRLLTVQFEFGLTIESLFWW